MQVCSTFDKLTTLQCNWGLALFNERRFLAKTWKYVPDFSKGRHSRDVVVPGFTFSYTINFYSHSGWEIDSRHAEVYSIQLYVMRFTRMVNFTGYCRLLHQNKHDPQATIEMVL